MDFLQNNKKSLPGKWYQFTLPSGVQKTELFTQNSFLLLYLFLQRLVHLGIFLMFVIKYFF